MAQGDRPTERRRLIGALAGLLAAAALGAAQAAPALDPRLSPRAHRCIQEAAVFHGVNADVLRAILIVESGGRPLALNRNRNGTYDIGIAQINSIHLQELARYGIRAEHLFDECIAAFVAGWHYARQVRAFGNSWQAIGAYHSRTPEHNQRYQRLVYRELVRMGARF